MVANWTLYKTHKKNTATITNTLPSLLSGRYMANSLHSYSKIPNIGDDRSNAPVVVYDGTSPVMRDSHSHHQTGFVIFIDALGVKGIWERMDPNVVFNRWKNIMAQFANSLQQTPLKQFKHYFTTISDTIIITCQCEPGYANYIFGLLIIPFIFSLESNFFLRGAISYGEYYLSTRLLIGPAIDEAAVAHSQIEMIGVFSTPELSNMLINSRFPNITSNCIRYPVIPTKRNRYDGFALNWPRHDNSNLFQILVDECNGAREKPIKIKYSNTIRFCQYAKSLN